MSNRDMRISVINSMEEWQLQSVLEMLNAVKGTFPIAFVRTADGFKRRGQTQDTCY